MIDFKPRKIFVKGAVSSRSTGHGIGVLVVNTPHDKVIIPLLLHK